MYLANAEYLSYIDTSIVRTACSKVVIDGVEYSGRTHLKIYPKISHVNSSMIGGFSAATCEFEIYNVDGSLNLNGKEIEVYRGLEINGAASWIPMGIFSATDDNITNNKTARSITFKGLDRASRFDVAFEQGEDITFPCTLLDFVQKLCARRGVALESTAFPMAELTIETAPNIPSNYTERQLISCAAELGGCIARINRSGNLEISKPYSTGRRISRSRYSAVSKEPVFGPINSVVLGREGYSDDIVYPAAAPDNLCEWRIEDNPFVENRREELIADIAANIIGMSFIPFKLTDCVEDYIFDINDSVEVECKDGTVFTATVLSKTTSSRIRTELKAETQKSSSTNRKIAGSIKDAVKRVQLDVDHQNNRINALVEDSVSRMELELLSDSITARFEDIETPDTVENVKNAVTSITKDGVNIENGALTLTDDNGNVLIGVNTDENGDMYVSGNIRANSLEAETVTSESIKSGAITADKLSVGIARQSNMLNNYNFSETYTFEGDTRAYAVGWAEKNGKLIPQTGAWGAFWPSSTDYSDFMQKVWLIKGRYSLIARMQFYKVSSVNSDATLRMVLDDTYKGFIHTQIDSDTVTNGTNKEVIFKFVFDYDGTDDFVNVGFGFRGFNFSSGYISITWTLLLKSDEEKQTGFYCSNSSWLADAYKSSHLIDYNANIDELINEKNPFNVGSDGELSVISGKIGGFSFSEYDISAESHVFSSLDEEGYNAQMLINIPHGGIDYGSLDLSVISNYSKALAPSIEIFNDYNSSFLGIGGLEVNSGSYFTRVGYNSIETSGRIKADSAEFKTGVFTDIDVSTASIDTVSADKITVPLVTTSVIKSASTITIGESSTPFQTMQFGVEKNVTSSGTTVSLSGFSGTPTVICIPLQKYAGDSHFIAVNVTEVSSTSFTVITKDMIGSYGSDVMWFAIGT